MLESFLEFSKTVALDTAPQASTLNVPLIMSGTYLDIIRHFKLGEKISVSKWDLLAISALDSLHEITFRLEAISPIAETGGVDDDLI